MRWLPLRSRRLSPRSTPTFSGDLALCHYVKQNEAAINSAQRELDEMAYELLAKEQPMAIDLRFILAVIKINGDLERDWRSVEWDLKTHARHFEDRPGRIARGFHRHA